MVSPNEVGCTRKVINVTETNVKFINHKTQKQIKGLELKTLQKKLNEKPKKEVQDKFDFFGVKKNEAQKKYGMNKGGFTKRGPCK